MLGLLAPGLGMGGSPPPAANLFWLFPRAGSTYSVTEPIRVAVAEGHVAQVVAEGVHVAQARTHDTHVAQVEAMEGRER